MLQAAASETGSTSATHECHAWDQCTSLLFFCDYDSDSALFQACQSLSYDVAESTRALPASEVSNCLCDCVPLSYHRGDSSSGWKSAPVQIISRRWRRCKQTAGFLLSRLPTAQHCCISANAITSSTVAACNEGWPCWPCGTLHLLCRESAAPTMFLPGR